MAPSGGERLGRGAGGPSSHDDGGHCQRHVPTTTLSTHIPLYTRSSHGNQIRLGVKRSHAEIQALLRFMLRWKTDKAPLDADDADTRARGGDLGQPGEHAEGDEAE